MRPHLAIVDEEGALTLALRAASWLDLLPAARVNSERTNAGPTLDALVLDLLTHT